MADILDDFIAEKKAGKKRDILDEFTSKARGKGPTQRAGPLDFRPEAKAAALLASAYTPQPVKDVVGTAAKAFGSRLGAFTGTLMEPVTELIKAEQGKQANVPTSKQFFTNLINSLGLPRPPQYLTGVPGGAPPLEATGPSGRNPYTATTEMMREIGVPEVLSPEQAEGMNIMAKGLPVGSLARYGLSPEGAALAAESVAGVSALNALGRKVLLPAGRAIANLEIGAARTRGLPAVKQALEFHAPGSSLPNEYRVAAQDLLRKAEGEADLAGYLREQAVGELRDLPVDIQDKIQTAIERRAVNALTPEERAAAEILQREGSIKPVEARTAEGLRPFELGAHLTPEEQAANVAHTPRALTAAGRQRAGLPYGGTPVSTVLSPEELAKKSLQNLGTGKMFRRVANPKLTAEEINRASIEAGGKRLIEPIVKSTLRLGAQNDLRVMNAKILNGLALRFGRATENSAEGMARRVIGSGSGFTKSELKRFSKIALPKEVEELARNLQKRFRPEEFGRLSAFMREVNNQFKTWALFSPGFVSRNVQNNVIQTAIFGNMDIRTWRDSFKVIDAMQSGIGLDKTIKVGGKAVKIGDYIEDSMRRGVIGRGQVAKETVSKLTEAKGSPFRALRDANQMLEDMSRTSFDLFEQRRGLSPIAAARRVDDVLFNYSNKIQSAAKSKLRRGYVPFINWSSQIGPLLARTTLERPGSLGLIGNIRQRQNIKAGYPTERELSLLGPDVVEQGGVVTGEKNGKAEVLLPTGYGTFSVNEYLPQLLNAVGNFDDFLDAALNQMYPQFNLTAATLGTKRDPLTGISMFNDSGAERLTNAPSALKAIFLIPGGREWARARGIILKKDGSIVAPARLSLLLRGFPPARIPSIIADLIQASPGSETRAKSFLTGVRSVERSKERGAEIQEMLRKREKQKSEAEERAKKRAEEE